MISELQEMAEHFKVLDEQLTDIMMKFTEKNFGINKEYVEAKTVKFICDGYLD